jgi:hypothetical protein
MAQRVRMWRQIADMDVVADAGAVRRRIIGAEHVELAAQAERRFGRNLDQMRGLRRRLAGAAARIGAGDVEIAQDDMGEIVGAAGVAQHDFGHQLRGAIGRDRLRRRILRHRNDGRIAVHRGGGGEDEMAHVAFNRAFDQGMGPTLLASFGVTVNAGQDVSHHSRPAAYYGSLCDNGGQLTYVSFVIKLTYMEKTQVYLRKEELDALRKVAARSRRSVAALVREAVRKVVLVPAAEGPIAIWDGEPKRSSLDHDSVHDEP